MPNVEVYTESRSWVMSLPFSASGGVVRVDPGTIELPQGVFSLPEFQEHALVLPFGQETTVSGYLVQDKGTGDVLMLIDEAGPGEAYTFGDGPYRMLELVFWANVAAGVTDADSIDWFYRTIGPPREV